MGRPPTGASTQGESKLTLRMVIPKVIRIGETIPNQSVLRALSFVGGVADGCSSALCGARTLVSRLTSLESVPA